MVTGIVYRTMKNNLEKNCTAFITSEFDRCMNIDYIKENIKIVITGYAPFHRKDWLIEKIKNELRFKKRWGHKRIVKKYRITVEKI
jgi:hypothetical protein